MRARGPTPPTPPMPPLALAAVLACAAGAAALLQCALAAAIMKRTKNGIYCLILQLIVADFVMISTSLGPEVWIANARTWDFGRSTCVAFRGLTVLTSSASLYLVVTIALHTLATINLEEKIAQSTRSAVDDESRSSRHSLVAHSDTSTPRTMNVDYRFATATTVPVAPPSLFVWFLSASLSIPEFVLATTASVDDVILCDLESSHRFNIHSLLALFNFFIPTSIMSTAGILVAFKLRSKHLRKNDKESVASLKLSISLIIVYFVLCFPRSLLHVYRMYFNNDIRNPINDNLFLIVNLICSCLCLGSTLLRPFLCIAILPRIRKKFFGSRGTVEV